MHVCIVSKTNNFLYLSTIFILIMLFMLSLIKVSLVPYVFLSNFQILFFASNQSL